MVVRTTAMKDTVAVDCRMMPASLMHIGQKRLSPKMKTDKKVLHMFQTHS